MATLAAAFAAATPRKSRGKRKTRLVTLGTLSGAGAAGIPARDSRTVQVRRAILPAIAPDQVATANSVQVHAALVAGAASSVSQLAALVSQLADLGVFGNAVQRTPEPFATPLYTESRRKQFGRKSRSVMRPVLTETAPGRVCQSLPAPVALRRISEAVAAIIAQYGG